MKIVQYGPGDPAWVEPETEGDEKLLDEARTENWTIAQIIAKALERGLCIS